MESKNKFVTYYKDTTEQINMAKKLHEMLCVYGDDRQKLQIEAFGAYFPTTSTVQEVLKRDDTIWGIVEVVDEKKYLLAKLKYGI
jgi:hypothetical protein